MTREQEFFLQVLSDHLNGKATNPPEGLDWPQIAKYAKSHEVEGIIYHQCKDYLSKHEELASVNDRLSRATAAAVFYYANRTAMVERLTEALDAEGIPYFIVKGAEVAQFYPVPAYRTMGDTDLVVHTEDRERVHAIMLAQGYENVSKFPDREWQYYQNKMEFELHDHLVYSEVVNVDEHTAYFNDFWKYVKDGELDWGFHFMFLLLHLRKHFMNSGVGFRQFMDLAVVADAKRDSVDWDWVENELNRLDLLRFAGNCFGFCKRWFGTQSPLPAAEVEDDFFEAATEKIFIDGIFGFENDENTKNTAINEARKSAGSNWVSMLRMATRRAFPGYQTLIKSEHYAFLKGKPLLLPAAWIYRIFRGVFRGKVDTGVKLVSESFASKEAYNKRNDMLNKWGL